MIALNTSLVALPLVVLALINETRSIGLRMDNEANSTVLPTTEKPLVCRTRFMLIGGRCLEIDPTYKGTWDETNNHCATHGGQMVKIDSGDLLYAIVRHITTNNLNGHDYWVGGTDRQNEGTFVWLDGTPVQIGSPFWGYDKKRRQEPNDRFGEDCIIMDKEYFFDFNDKDCGHRASGICEQADEVGFT